ncbi:UNVERIFIED_CONTAM: hypothetical protein FKN15_027235 [Acipenser sinensis]
MVERARSNPLFEPPKRLREVDGGSAGGRNVTRSPPVNGRGLEHGGCSNGTVKSYAVRGPQARQRNAFQLREKTHTMGELDPAGPPQAQARPLDGRAPGLLDHAGTRIRGTEHRQGDLTTREVTPDLDPARHEASISANTAPSGPCNPAGVHQTWPATVTHEEREPGLTLGKNAHRRGRVVGD